MSQAEFVYGELELETPDHQIQRLQTCFEDVIATVRSECASDARLGEILRDTAQTEYLERNDTTEREAPERFTEDEVIEPLFDALGLTDLSQRPGDFADDRGQEADYATRIDSKRLLVEAEPLNKNLGWQEVGIDQVEGWLANRRFDSQYGIATNGIRWVLIKYNSTTYEFDVLADVSLREAFCAEFERLTGHTDSLARYTQDEQSDTEGALRRLARFFAQDNLRRIVGDADDIIKLKQQAITDDFYQDYIRLVFGVDEETGETTARSLTRGGVRVPETIARRFDNPLRVFAVSLMNRLIFIKFLEDNHLVEEDLLLGMRSEYEDSRQLDDFYSAYLHPLFYHVFNQRREEREGRAAEFFEETPYLNGGLFRPVLAHDIDLNESDYTMEELIYLEQRFEVSDSVIMEIIDLLESYRFTTDGGVDTIEEKPINALDPSILGNVFEKTINYLAGEDGKQKDLGAFYTPDEITRFAASETIRPVVLEKLQDELRARGWQDAEVTRYDDVDALVEALPPTTDLIDDLQETLDSVTVCDPACGSGHFLTSVLDELMAIRGALAQTVQNTGLTSQTRMDLKKRTIRQNIFGVDIVAPAVEIAKLRLWLSVIGDLDPEAVETLDDEEIALPNVTFNIRVGNSLLGFPDLQVRRGAEATITEANLLDKISRYDDWITEARQTHEGIESMLAEMADLRQTMTDSVDSAFTRLVDDLSFEDARTLPEPDREQVGNVAADLADTSADASVSSIGFYVAEPDHPLTETADSYTEETLENLGFTSHKWKAKRSVSNGLTDDDMEALVDAIAGHPEGGVRELYAERTVSQSDLDSHSRFHWVVEFPEGVQIESNATGMESATFGFDIIIGNPPFGADISGLEADLIEREEFFTCHGANNSAEYFLERAIQLTRTGGRIGFVLPKTLSYYTTWSEIRTKLLADSPPVSVFDNGLAFPGVNYEQVTIIASPTAEADPSLEVHTHVAEDLRDETANAPDHTGSVPLDTMQSRGTLVLRPLSDADRAIIEAFGRETVPLRELWATEPWRGVYVPDSTKEELDSGETPFLESVPSIQRYYVQGEDIWYIDLEDLPDRLNENAQETMVPRLLFKVMRGSELYVSLDEAGQFASTEKLVNVPIDGEATTHTLRSLLAVLNAPAVSYYLQKLIFSETTETARVMDAHYIEEIPIPVASEREVNVLDRVTECLLFASQYHDDGYGGGRAEDVRTLLTRVANSLVADLYLDCGTGGSWSIVAEACGDDILGYESWASERFSAGDYPEVHARTMWESVTEFTTDLREADILDRVDNVESDPHVQRLHDVLNT